MRAWQEAAVASLLAVLCAGVKAAGPAQSYPTKPVRIITGATGTFHDIVSRQLGQRLSERWGQPVVVENKPGAGGTIGAGTVVKSNPDGYTLLMSDRTAIAVAPVLHKSLPYDPIADLAPITLAARAPMMLVAHPSVPASNLREFIAYARQQPGGFNMAGAGPGTAAHMTAEHLKVVTGLNLTSVQYKGGGAATLAIVGGEVRAGFANIPNVLPHVTAGKLKAYAVTSKTRFAGAPDVPAAAEAGLPGFESEQWIGMLAPARTRAELIGKLNRDMVEFLRTSEMQAAMRAQGAEPAPGTPAEFALFIKSEMVKLGKVIEVAGIKPE